MQKIKIEISIFFKSYILKLRIKKIKPEWNKGFLVNPTQVGVVLLKVASVTSYEKVNPTHVGVILNYIF